MGEYLSLRHGTDVVKNPATTICDSCRLPHHSVRQTKDTVTWCNVGCRPHIRGLSQPCHESMQLSHMGSVHICRSISRDVACTMVACIVGTLLDYCNPLLHGVTEKLFNKLQESKASLLESSNHTSAAHFQSPS